MRETSGSVFDYLAKNISASGTFHSRKSGVVAAYGDVLHAVDADGHPTVLVPIGELRDGLQPWHSKSLLLQTVDLAVDEGKMPFVVLRCIVPDLNQQFGLLVDDVLDAIEGEPGRAAQVVSLALDRWRNLFEDAGGGVLGPAQLAGLWAELTFLGEVVKVHGPASIASWRGPSGGRHDFVFAGCSVEIKATTNQNNMIVTIHGGRQLDHPDNGDLYIRAFQLEQSPNGVSVPEKIEHLVTLGVSRIELLVALRGVNYHYPDSLAYASSRFVLLTQKSYLVDDWFPRISSETLVPPGMIDRLGNISYSIDLGQLEPTEHDVRSVQLASSGGL